MKTDSRIANLIIHFVIAISLSACGKSAKVTGKVIGNANKPLSNAIVSIEGTQFQTTTDSNGDYSIPYVPGKFTIKASAPLHLYAHLPLEITQAATFPAAPIKLVQLPDSEFDYNLKNALLKETVRDNIRDKTYFFSTFAEIQALTVDKFDQTGELEIIGTVSARYKALVDLNSSQIRNAFSPFSGFDRGQRENAIWDQKFRVKLQLQERNTWQLIEYLPM